jgi:hypothetical protein
MLTFSLMCCPVFAQWLQPGESDFTKAVIKVLPVRGNLTLIQIGTPQATFNSLVLVLTVTCWWITPSRLRIRRFKKPWMLWASAP